jgi:aldehyde:ferredoxin oxidoreductase
LAEEIEQKVLTRFDYEPQVVDKGYNNRTLYVNLSDNRIESKPVSEQMKELFTGGKGFDIWLMWNSLPKDRAVKWDEPENELCIACGPLGGTTMYPGSGKSIVASISPLTNNIVDSNVGGYFGPYLKFAGWDALEIQGKAESDVVIFIDGDDRQVSIIDAEGLPEETHLLGDELSCLFGKGEDLKISIVSAGPGARNTWIGCLNFSWWDRERRQVRYKQAGRGGLGTVFRDKKILAIVVRTDYPQPKWTINHGEVPKSLEALYGNE